MAKHYNTTEAAQQAGIHWVTLYRWLESGKIKPSIAIKRNRLTVWLWTPADIRKLKRYKAKHYAKGRGRKPKAGRAEK